MKIAVLGTRGVPNNHGGFEQFAEYFSKYLAEAKHEVYVFNSHNHPYQEKMWNGVHILHEYDPEFKIGTAGQFIYDLNCILKCRKMDFDIILQLGYTSSSIWSFLFPKKSVIVTNMDGLEWKRSKYSKKTRFFLKQAERWGAKYSDFLISDSIGIQNHLLKTYNKKSDFIAYGADVFTDSDENILLEYKLKKEEYSMLIARMEPENNIETILEGFHQSNAKEPFLVIGKVNKFGEYLKEKYATDGRILFLGAIYNQNHLNNLRYFSKYYFHGHSVGGTNPSLLEAMSSNALIIAHDNIFNKSILNDESSYFSTSEEITKIFNEDKLFDLKKTFCTKNIEKINKKYNWSIINKQYELCLEKCFEDYNA